MAFSRMITVNDDVHWHIMSYLTLYTLRVYGTTSSTIYSSVKDYLHRAYDIDALLTPFIPVNHIALFRNIQHMTKTIIAGSLALQFMQCVRFPSSDMDLYVQTHHARLMASTLETAGCRLLGEDGSISLSTSGEHLTDMTTQRIASMLNGNDGDMYDSNGTVTTYSMNGITAILNFQSSTGRKIQLMVTLCSPVKVILGYHSTAVMNFITATHCYALYGWETLECGVSLYTRLDEKHLFDVLVKYSRRGWSAIVNGSEAADFNIFPPGRRKVGDALTWIVRLNAVSGLPSIQNMTVSGAEERTYDNQGSDTEIREEAWSLEYSSWSYPCLRADEPFIGDGGFVML